MDDTYVLSAASVTSAVELPSASVESLLISFTSYPFKLNEPVKFKLPVLSCVSSIVSPSLVLPL